MKLLFFAAAAAAAALVPAAVAFSSSSTSRTTRRQKPTSFASLHHERAPLSTITSLQSSFVKETTTLSTADFNLDTTDDSPTVAATLQQPSLQQKRSYLDDGFVFGLEGSGLDRPKGKVSQLVVEGDSLETTNWQRAVVWGTMLGHAGFLATAFAEMLQVNQGNVAWTMMQSVLLVISSWILADFGSGVLHWSVDNYGNGRTPIMGGIIAAFQGHHSAPWTITERGFENNVYKLCVPFGIATMGILSYLTGPFTTFFLTVFCVLEILSQEFHKWSHMTKSQTPAFVEKLQKAGLTIGRTPHAQHHLAPYDGNYCIISGVCNPILDKSGFFRRLERLVYNVNGVESNAWKLDADLRDRTLKGNYQLID